MEEVGVGEVGEADVVVEVEVEADVEDRREYELHGCKWLERSYWLRTETYHTDGFSEGGTSIISLRSDFVSINAPDFMVIQVTLRIGFASHLSASS